MPFAASHPQKKRWRPVRTRHRVSGLVQHGLGQTLSYLQSTFTMNGVMGLLVLLASLGMLVTRGMTRLEKALLKWQ